MLMAWKTQDANALALAISIFAFLYIAGGYLLQVRSKEPLIWAGLIAASSIGYYFLGYYKLQNTELTPTFWSALALAFAAFSTCLLQDITKRIPENYFRKQHLMSVYAAMGTAFLSIALVISLPREFLSVALAAQLFAVTWINTKVEVKALRGIACILACAFGFLLIPQLIFLIQLTAYSLIEVRLILQSGIPIIDWPIFQLGLPAMFFALGSYLLRTQRDDELVQSFEIASISLIGVMGYYIIRHAFHINEDVLFVTAGFIERGVITNILFIYGLLCLWIGKKFTRQAILLSGFVLSVVATFRIGYFDLFIYNPLWSLQDIGSIPIFNALLLTYGFPILWTWLALQNTEKEKWNKYGYAFILLLFFVLISFNVRQIFHGEYLNRGETSSAEIYTYSIVWMIFGMLLLFFGTMLQKRIIRIASLIVIISTIGKVFLYDASELQGLLRVSSFFALGLSLLGVSWFYGQFVFGHCRSGTSSKIAQQTAL